VSYALRRIHDYEASFSYYGESKIRCGVSAVLILRCIGDRVVPEVEFDELAVALCDLLSFATYNRVSIAHTLSVNDTGDAFAEDYFGVKIPEVNLGKHAIPNRLIGKDDDDSSLHTRNELEHFITKCYPKYLRIFGKRRFRLAFDFLVNSMHADSVALEYIMLFLALEQLVRAIPVKPQSAQGSRDRWDTLLSKKVIDDIVQVVEKHIPSLTNSMKKRILRKLHEAGNPDLGTRIRTLCQQHNVLGFQDSHVKLRNELFHEGEPTSFFEEHVKTHSSLLRYVVQTLVLRHLDYDGFCCSEIFDWQSAFPVSMQPRFSFSRG